MYLSQLKLPRRTFLRGLGATVALPFLDAMVPAMARAEAADAARRLVIVYVPNGMAMEYWTPAALGAGFEFTPVLEPLQPFREHLSILSNLNGAPGGGSHAGASTRFLTGLVARTTRGEAAIKASTSMDQIAAQHIGSETRLASLELALDGRDFVGSCDAGYSCAYTNTIAWRGESTPLPMENNPRVVFERMFGDISSTTAAERSVSMRRTRSVLDVVLESAANLRGAVGVSDRHKIDEYLESVRDAERRIQQGEARAGQELPALDQPSGIPLAFADHAKMMFDLQVLALQTDVTRVITFMMGRELSGRSYPEIGVTEAHHPLSHHEGDPARIATMSKVNRYHMEFFADFVRRLRDTADGGSSLLGHTTVIYGAGMSESNDHVPRNLPVLLLGHGAAKGGGHIKFSDGTPLSNLMVSVLDGLGVPVDRLGDSTGKLAIPPV